MPSKSDLVASATEELKAMPSSSYRQIEVLLRDELEKAAKDLDADRDNRSKWADYGKAAQRFNDFILNGKVPSDLVSETAATANGSWIPI